MKPRFAARGRFPVRPADGLARCNHSSTAVRGFNDSGWSRLVRPEVSD